MDISEQDREMLEQLEQELWREETRFDIARMKEMIAEDFFEFGRSGRRYTREDTLSVPRQPIEAVFPLPGFSARLLSEDVAQVTYNSSVTYNGVAENARRSSIWSRTANGWVLRFHQGTPIPGDA
jgi:hypothetical protein